VRPG